MNKYLLYGIITVLLFVLEVVYFRMAARFNIIDKPNERSSHSSIVLRGGGIIFLFGVWLWCVLFGFHYPLFLAAVTLAAGISFIDDIHSLPDSVRLVIQFIAMGLMIGQIFLSDSFVFGESLWAKIAFVVIALIVCVGATNIYNFMDGINGITAGAGSFDAYECSCRIRRAVVSNCHGSCRNGVLVLQFPSAWQGEMLCR